MICVLYTHRYMEIITAVFGGTTWCTNSRISDWLEQIGEARYSLLVFRSKYILVMVLTYHGT